MKNKLYIKVKGGEGSGFFKHIGRPGMIGGSSTGGGSGSTSDIPLGTYDNGEGDIVAVVKGGSNITTPMLSAWLGEDRGGRNIMNTPVALAPEWCAYNPQSNRWHISISPDPVSEYGLDIPLKHDGSKIAKLPDIQLATGKWDIDANIFLMRVKNWLKAPQFPSYYITQHLDAILKATQNMFKYNGKRPVIVEEDYGAE